MQLSFPFPLILSNPDYRTDQNTKGLWTVQHNYCKKRVSLHFGLDSLRIMVVVPLTL